MPDFGQASGGIAAMQSRIATLEAALSAGAGAIQGALFGLALSKSAATTVGVAAGFCTDKSVAASIVLPATTKTFAAFGAGSGNGGLDTGAIAANTWYHVHAISKALGASPDVLISLSATAPTMPATFTLSRRIGSIFTDATPNIIGFTQTEDEFLWDVPRLDVNTAAPGTVAVLAAVSAPLGVKTQAIILLNMLHTVAASSIITSPDSTDTAPDTANQFSCLVNGVSQIGCVEMRVRTNLLSQLRYRNAVSPITQFVIRTRGYLDTRGRNV